MDTDSHILKDLASFFPPIDSSIAQVRLLELHSAPPSSDISFSFQIVNLDKLDLSYEALSYAWRGRHGEEPQKQPIYVDGSPIEVSQSLFEALKQLRSDSGNRFLWIDAICINQADDDEKTWQVNLMRRIYTQCSQCIIWLGLSDTSLHSPEDAHIAADTIAWIAGEGNMPPWHQDHRKLGRAAAAVKSLMSVSWWSRIWTVQEAVLPSRATVYWGPAKLPWELMQRAADRLISEPQPHILPKELDQNGGLTDLQASLLGLKHSSTEHPLFLFWRWRFRDATDPRDKIYGLMGIRENLHLHSVRSCDYTVDVVTLYTRVTADLIRKTCDLEPLIGRRGEEPAIAGLPSWAIDWSRPWNGNSYWLHQARWRNLGYTADAGIYGVGDGLRTTNDGRVLILSAVFVDKVLAVEQLDDLSGGLTPEVLLSGGEKWERLFEAYQRLKPQPQPDGKWMQNFLGLMMGRLDPHNPDQGGNLHSWALEIIRSQVIFMTESGLVGVGATRVQPGHELWILGGCKFPVILDLWKGHQSESAVEGRGDFVFVGDCFVYGIMKGEAVRGEEHVTIRLH